MRGGGSRPVAALASPGWPVGSVSALSVAPIERGVVARTLLLLVLCF